MERYKLDDFEQRCIQDELPYCQAACPLKVDVRPFAGPWRKTLRCSKKNPGKVNATAGHYRPHL